MGEFFELSYTQLLGLLYNLVSPDILCSGSRYFLLSKCKNARYSSVFIQQSVNCRYNEKAQEWMQIGIKEMQNANLQLFVYGLEFPLFSDQNRPGKYFPIRDNCSKSDDPSVGCIYVSSYSLTTNVTLTKDYYIPFVISDGPRLLLTQHYGKVSYSSPFNQCVSEFDGMKPSSFSILLLSGRYMAIRLVVRRVIAGNLLLTEKRFWIPSQFM